MSDAPLMLSVSGARGIVGKTMTPAFAADFASAFGSHMRETSGEARPLICIGRDSRPSGAELAHAAAESLISLGCRVIDLGIVATPTVGLMIGERGAHGGLVITASHNPSEWNGLKCLDACGSAPPADVVQRILQRLRERDFASVAETKLPIERDTSSNEHHIAKTLSQVDVDAIRAAKLKVALDSVNGAGGPAGRMLLEALGCEVVHINDEPNGCFPHTPEPLEENLRELASITASERAACGFAQDPDADRLAIIDENGRYIGEEHTLVLAAKRVLDARSDRRTSSPSAAIAANLSTSRMIDDLAAQYPGAIVIRTAVGEANVVAAMKPAGAIIGGEGNGGVILPSVCWVRDSISAMALVLWLMAAEGKPLSAIVDALPRYVMVKRKLDASAIGGREAIDAALQRVRDAFAHERINTADGVRIDFADGWVHLRPSNTEPIVRLIAEAGTIDRADALVAMIAQAAGIVTPNRRTSQ